MRRRNEKYKNLISGRCQIKLGKLQEVDIRKVWQHEQYDFSKWFAGEENIQELGDALNLSLTDQVDNRKNVIPDKIKVIIYIPTK